MKAYTSEDNQGLYLFMYVYDGQPREDYVVAYDMEWAKHKFSLTYPNVPMDSVSVHGVAKVII